MICICLGSCKKRNTVIDLEASVQVREVSKEAGGVTSLRSSMRKSIWATYTLDKSCSHVVTLQRRQKWSSSYSITFLKKSTATCKFYVASPALCKLGELKKYWSNNTKPDFRQTGTSTEQALILHVDSKHTLRIERRVALKEWKYWV